MFGNFCKGEIWNSSLNWDTPNPDLSPCFRDVIIPGVPCGLLWLTLPLWYLWVANYHPNLRVKNSEGKSSPNFLKERFTRLLKAKVAVHCLIIVLAALELLWRLYEIKDDSSIAISDVFYPGCLFASTLLSLAMMLKEKLNCIRSSPSLSLFWPILTITLVPNVKIEIGSLLEQIDYLRFVITLTLLPACTVLSLLNCWADVDDLEPINSSYDGTAPNNLNSFFSSVFLSWMNPIIWKGYKVPLSQKDLFALPTKVNVDFNVKTFQRHYHQYLKRNNINFQSHKGLKDKQKGKAKLWTPFLKTFGKRFLLSNTLAFIHYSITFLGPQILKLLISHIEDTDDYAWKGFLYSVLLLCVYFTSTIFFTSYLVHMYTIAVQARSVVVSAIMTKMLKLSNNARKQFTTGQITNLVSVDAQRLMESIPYLCILWSAPYQASVGMVLVYNELGPSALAGAAVLAVLVPINALGSKLAEILQRKQLKAKDSRIKLMNEILSGIKVLKLYAWEWPFIQRILSSREKELNIIKKNAILNSLNNFTMQCSSILITIGAFSAYTLSNPTENVLTPQKVFVSMAYFNLMRIPLTLFPMTLREAIKAYVSLQRITKFLNAEELDENNVDTTTKSGDNDIEIESATLSWDEQSLETPTLKGINCDITRGSLVAIVGTVGSGKSSILAAILGEMEKIQGRIATQGSIAYVAQQAWIQNLSLKDNILFGQTYDLEKYNKVIDGCALKADLAMLANADDTEIGENGINLSGGQKQRVNLARAVYSSADIFLLDDPLSAVDVHVSKHIFERIIGKGGLLQGKTRLWVTNNLTYLSQVDQIIVIDQGQVLEQGTYEDLMRKKKKSQHQSYLSTMIQVEESTKSEDTDKEAVVVADESEVALEQVVEEPNEVPTQTQEKLVKEEVSETGRVKFSTYLAYFRTLGYSFSLLFVTLVGAIESLHLAGNIWLSKWSDANNIDDGDAIEANIDDFLPGYIYIGLSEMIIKLLNDLSFFNRCAYASKRVHRDLLNNVMKSPMKFFDTNPMGRILNRFTSDMDTIDQMIPYEILDFTWCLIECIVVILLICITTPIFVAVVIPLLGLYYYIQSVYIASSRQLKRLYSVSKSPIFAHFSETTNGAQTIRAYRQQARFIQESQKRMTTNVKSIYLNLMSNRWLGIRLEGIGNMFVFFAALFAVLARESLTAGQAGLSITSSLQIIGALVWVVRQACMLETDCVAIERIMEYTNNEQEAAWQIPQTDLQKSSWPEKGNIQFQSYQTKYRPGLDLVLKGITMDIHGQEKIGICGRTGAGKSSLTLALFRIIEASQGAITIDGQDISLLGLHTLRSRLTIIPQDPVLFTGDLRFNLDPVGEHNDDALWKSLEQSHLKNHILTNLSDGLDSEVTEGGTNFSVGQRQLICLARALLRKTQILVLDEATAAIDQETDNLIQKTLKTEFAHCTVLTIAHRLHTILDSDRIAVFEKGLLKEFDTPSNLLQTEDSSFKAMVNDSNLK